MEEESPARLERKKAKRAERENIFIACEGKETEPNYFRAFKVTSARIKAFGKGFNTKSLVKDTKKINEKARINGEPYDQVWCVFDRDSFTKEDFNSAIQMAREYEFHVAYSNEAFELWYILHFEYLVARVDRKAYRTKLTKFLDKKYKKNDG